MEKQNQIQVKEQEHAEPLQTTDQGPGFGSETSITNGSIQESSRLVDSQGFVKPDLRTAEKTRSLLSKLPNQNQTINNNQNTDFSQISSTSGLSNANNSSQPSNLFPFSNQLESEQAKRGVKRDRTASEFVLMMDHYTSVIPDVVSNYYLTRSGFDCSDRRVKRILSLATQKFLSDVAADAYQYCKIRTHTIKDKKAKNKKTTLLVEDLSLGLSEYGINVKKPEYYV